MSYTSSDDEGYNVFVPTLQPTTVEHFNVERKCSNIHVSTPIRKLHKRKNIVVIPRAHTLLIQASRFLSEVYYRVFALQQRVYNSHTNTNHGYVYLDNYLLTVDTLFRLFVSARDDIRKLVKRFSVERVVLIDDVQTDNVPKFHRVYNFRCRKWFSYEGLKRSAINALARYRHFVRNDTLANYEAYMETFVEQFPEHVHYSLYDARHREYDHYVAKVFKRRFITHMQLSQMQLTPIQLVATFHAVCDMLNGSTIEVLTANVFDSSVIEQFNDNVVLCISSNYECLPNVFYYAGHDVLKTHLSLTHIRKRKVVRTVLRMHRKQQIVQIIKLLELCDEIHGHVLYTNLRVKREVLGLCSRMPAEYIPYEGLWLEGNAYINKCFHEEALMEAIKTFCKREKVKNIVFRTTR